MAALNPHAAEFSPYYCSQYWFVNPNQIVHLYSFTGLTITAGTPPPYQYFTYHRNTNIGLVGPAWFTHLPPLLPPVLHNQQEPVVEECEASGVHHLRRIDNSGTDKNKKKIFQGREKWREEKKPREKWREEKKDTSTSEDLQPIKRRGKLTTVMIKNIPNQYTREMLMNMLDEHCKEENNRSRKDYMESGYDFLYLPIDFKSNCNKGYAFVNFTYPNAAWNFSLSWRHRKWPDFKSSKIREITYAKLQGKEALIEQFKDSVFPCDKEEYLPVRFVPPRNGSDRQRVQLCTVGVAAGRPSHSPR